MNQSYIKIAARRNKSTEDHDSYKYAIYAVGKRKPGALPLSRYTDLFFPSYLRLVFCNLTLLSSKQEGFKLACVAGGNCVGAKLKFWRRSRVPKKESRDEAVEIFPKKGSRDEVVEIFLAASPIVTAPPSNLTRLYYNASAAKSHSTTTQYRQLRRRVH